MFLNSESVDESSIIATNGGYISEEISGTYKNADMTGGNDESKSSNRNHSNYDDSTAYYDYDITTENIVDEQQPESIVDVSTDSIEVSRSFAVKGNFLIYFFISIVIYVFL